MKSPKFTQFQNEEGTYTIVYDVNGANETIVGFTGKRDVALNSVKELNKVLLIERKKIVITTPPNKLILKHENYNTYP